MPFADHHDMVETFPSNRAHHSLGTRVLLRRARRNHRFPHLSRKCSEQALEHEEAENTGSNPRVRDEKAT